MLKSVFKCAPRLYKSVINISFVLLEPNAKITLNDSKLKLLIFYPCQWGVILLVITSS